MTLEPEEESLAATLRQVQPKGMSVSRPSRAIPGVKVPLSYFSSAPAVVQVPVRI